MKMEKEGRKRREEKEKERVRREREKEREEEQKRREKKRRNLVRRDVREESMEERDKLTIRIMERVMGKRVGVRRMEERKRGEGGPVVLVELEEERGKQVLCSVEGK